MLKFERLVVGDLTTVADPELRSRVAAWVDGTLGDMPDGLRLGVAAESLLFSVWRAVRRPADVNGLLGWLDRSPVSLLRSYPRLFRSLVLFGELELAEGSRS